MKWGPKRVLLNTTLDMKTINIVFLKGVHMSTMNQIRSYNITINKLCLSQFVDKSHILDDGVSSLAYGNWRI